MSKVWFITGSARGLGRNIVEAALAEGDRVAATARDPKKLNDLVAEHGDSVLPLKLDVTDPTEARSAIAAAVEHFGQVDVVVNNAGYANVAPAEDFTDEDFREQIETNLWGVINVSRAALPFMRERGEGSIIQISSIGGRDGNPGLAPYQTAKFAVEGFTGVLRKEVAPLGIRVTSVDPGSIRTDWAGSSMTVHEIREAYQPTVGLVAGAITAEQFMPVGDPAKMAAAVVAVSGMDDPPAQLLLGSDAIEMVSGALNHQIEEIDRWKDLTLSTDADDAVPMDLSFLTR